MGQFIQNEILGMKWLNRLIGRALSALGADVSGRIGGSVQFFLYDVIKITILLCVLIFLISYIQSYFPPERSRRIMSRFHGIRANLISALLGTVTPFCSCSSIPIFMGFTGAGLPLGVTFSFLISSPMVDLGSLVLLMGIFGSRIAAVYVLVGLLIAVAGGTVIERLHMEDQVEDFIRSARPAAEPDSPELTVRDRLLYAVDQTASTFRKVFPYILLGVADSQLDPAAYCGDGSREPESIQRRSGDAGGRSDVRGYFRDDSCGGGASGKGRPARNRAQLHDGRHDAQSSVSRYAEKSGKTKTSDGVHRRVRCGNHHRGIWIQRISGCSDVIRADGGKAGKIRKEE